MVIDRLALIDCVIEGQPRHPIRRIGYVIASQADGTVERIAHAVTDRDSGRLIEAGSIGDDGARALPRLIAEMGR